MGYTPKYFKLYEVAPPALLTKPEAFLWHLFDNRILMAADTLRQRYGKMIANTWRWGGEHQWRGFRTRNCQIGAEYSQHRFGRALDLVPADCTAQEVRDDLVKDCRFLNGLVTRVEAGVPWLHIDCANYGIGNRIHFFNP